VLAQHLHGWTAADADGHAGQYFRVEGSLLTGSVSGPVYWAPKGTGRGGNNYAGAGALIDEITEDENEYYGLDAGDFPEPSGDGPVLILLSTP
jgi:hypothetical protein